MKLITSNSKANYEYFLFDKFEAGIVLKGCEVKSLRNNQASLDEAFVLVRNNEAWIKNLYIKPYDKANDNNLDARCDRKLLLNKNEILKLIRGTREKSYTIIPTKMFFSGPYVKLEIALAKGKKLYDKRLTIKKREINRQIRQEKL